MFYGKIVAGLLGLLVGGPIGLVVGIFIGHSFDKGLVKTLQFGSPENIERIKKSFFETTFLLLGYLAKADGRVSQQEIDHTETLFSQMGLTGQQRVHAKDLFRAGAASDFKLEQTVSTFLQTCGPRKQLQQTLLLFLISLALADQAIDEAEHAALQDIARLMGFSVAQLEQLLRMVQAQGQFHTGAAGQSPASSLSNAYEALGVSEAATDKEVKRAYRKLMSQNHPDKLIARGVPEDMIKIATEKSQDISGAYDLIRKNRDR
ncbi:MAG: co-chaperone DjlA [Proteobacteria bacterium]|nr:co-chaperone DjlA [Pseudomonadota bacterium]